MIPPRCVVCKRKPVRRRWRACRTPKRGLRILDGVSWNWFCSQRCSGRDCGRTNIRSGRVQLAVQRAAEGRRRRAALRQIEEVADEVRVLMHYGMPRLLAIATLTRLVRRAREQASAALYYELVGKPRREAART